MPGTMNGGGTIIGPGRRWSDHPDFPVGEQPVVASAPSVSAITQAELLAALGITKREMRSKHRGGILKGLLADDLLLDTGQPNPFHPKVAAIIAKKGKPKRQG